MRVQRDLPRQRHPPPEAAPTSTGSARLGRAGSRVRAWRRRRGPPDGRGLAGSLAGRPVPALAFVFAVSGAVVGGFLLLSAEHEGDQARAWRAVAVFVASAVLAALLFWGAL